MSNSEGNFEMTINCEVNLFLIWCEECVIVTGTTDNRIPTFAKTDTKLYVPVLTLSAQDNAKLYQQLRTVSKRTINWKKYQSKPISGRWPIFNLLGWSKFSESK